MAEKHTLDYRVINDIATGHYEQILAAAAMGYDFNELVDIPDNLWTVFRTGYDWKVSILGLVVISNNTELLKLLLENKEELKININVEDELGDTPLSVASRPQVKYEIFELLLDNGADPRIEDKTVWGPLDNLVYYIGGVWDRKMGMPQEQLYDLQLKLKKLREKR